MKKAAFYARVSTEVQQKEGTIDSQVAELKKQISRAGDHLVKEYVDDGYSGALLDRPAMNQLRDDLRNNLFDVVYVWNADRIARDVTYQNLIVAEILQRKKQLIINGKDYINNPENKFTLTVLGAVSELERAKYIERTTRGRNYRLKQGMLMSNGHQAYGYKYFRKTETSFPYYEIIESEAKVIRYIFETYAKGQVSIKEIARELKPMGVKDRNLLGFVQVNTILNNEMYTGVRYFNSMLSRKNKRYIYRDRSEWIGVKIPAIISKALFEKVKVRLDYNRKCWRNSKQPQLLANLVWCDKCDARCFAYRRIYHKRERMYRRNVYKCQSGIAFHNPEINSEVLASSVMDVVRQTILVPEKIREFINFLGSKQRANQTKIEMELKEIDEKIKSITGRKEKITNLFIADDLDRSEYGKRNQAYEAEIESFKKRRKELLKYIALFQKTELLDASISSYCAATAKKLEASIDFEAKRQFFLDHITKIAYRRKDKGETKIKVHGNIPISIAESDEPVNVGFTVKHTIAWEEYRKRFPQTLVKFYYRAPLKY